MKKRDRYLTGILLILIGVLIGIISAVYQQSISVNDRADVRYTEIKRSETPAYNSEELAKLDSRFLFKNIARQVVPTVVYIETIVPVDNGNRYDEYHDDEGDDSLWDRFFQHRARTVGSGVIISEDGYILTNNHVIEGAVDEGIQVVLNDKRVFTARIVGSDPTTDLAILKIDAKGLPSIVIGNSDEVDVGEWVLAVGNPFRLRSTVTAGIVSALSRDVQIINSRMRIESFIQTDAAINRGNSGGALVNTSGELIGINTAIASQSGNYQGYGFAVPSNLASKVARDLIEYGEVHRARLGVSIMGVNAIRAQELGMDIIRGVEIIRLWPPNGSAAESGLRQHDVILSIDGSEVNESNELQEKIAVMRPGEIVHLEVWRDGKEFDKHIKLGLFEGAENAISSNSLEQDPIEKESPRERINSATFELGFEVMAFFDPDQHEKTNLVITDITRGSEAYNGGLEEGYIIREVNGKKVEDLQTLRDLVDRRLKAEGSVLLQIETRDGATGFYELENNKN